MPIWVGLRGYEVECIWLDWRQVLRLSQRVSGNRYLIAYCRTVEELVQHGIDLADLVEVTELGTPGFRGRRTARSRSAR